MNWDAVQFDDIPKLLEFFLFVLIGFPMIALGIIGVWLEDRK